ncbi:hypothetical protein EPN81_01560 [Patescibacteria group bacterium]|nr:MAG: hypothetical protein EPN81_01560 [Patescibacteria group bacterium]
MEKGIIPRVITAYQDDGYRWEIHRAMIDFFDGMDKSDIAELLYGNPDVEGWFNEWLLYDFQLENGYTLLEDFVHENPLNLSEEELGVYRDLLDNEAGFYEILKVEKKKSLHLRSITTGHEFFVLESQGTIGVKKGHILYARVGRVGDHYELVGSNGVYLDLQLGEHLQEQLLGSGEKINSKVVYQFMRPHLEERSQTFGDFTGSLKLQPQKDIEPAQARAVLASILKKHRLDRYVDVATIETWIQNLDDSHSDLSYLTMLLGLLRGEASEQDLNEVIQALMDVYSTTQQDRLGGKSPLQKSREMKRRNPEIIADQIPLCTDEWIKKSQEAMEHMKRGKSAQAVDKFQEAFRILLKQQTTNPEIYRLFANAAIAHLMRGDLLLGEKMVDISLEFNPNYDFGLQVKRDLQRGTYDAAISSRLCEKMDAALSNPEHPMNRWNPEKVAGMTTSEILAQLEVFGIVETEETFRTKIANVPTRDLFIDELYTHYTGEEKDEDFVIHAVLTLSERLCSDQWFAEDLSEQMEQLSEQAKADLIDSEEVTKILKRIESFQDAPVEVLEYWKQEYSSSAEYFIEACIELLYDHVAIDQIIHTASILERTFNESFFSIVPLVRDVLHTDAVGWQKILASFSQTYPYDPHCYLFLAYAWSLRGNFEQEEQLLLDALEIVQERERESVLEPIRPFHEDLIDAYHSVFEALIAFYEECDEDQVALYVGKQQAIAKRIDLYTQESLERKISLEKNASEIWNSEFQNDAGYQYYEYLKKFNICFATDALTESKRIAFSANGKKLGRNEPCPCGARTTDGSSRKFKKCCGA